MTTKARAREIRAMIYLFITALIWGLAFVAQLVGSATIGSFTFNAVRFALGGAALLPVIWVMERKTPRAKVVNSLKAAVVCGIILFAAGSLQQFGIALTNSAGKSAFITDLYTVLVPIMGLFMGRKTSYLTWIGAALACAGLYFLSVPDGLGSVTSGDIALFIGAIFWSLHIIYVDKYADGVAPLTFSAIQFFICSALSFAGAFMFEDVKLSVILDGYVSLMYCGLLSVGVAYTLQIFGQRGVEPAKAAIIFSLESLFSAVGAAIILHEIMTGKGYFGCALIFAGIILSQIKPKTKQTAP